MKLRFKPLVSYLALASALFISSPSIAQDTKLILNYDGFFDRLDDLDEPEYADITLGFYFRKLGTQEPCGIRSAVIKSQTDERNVYFYPSGEVILPFDEQLDMDKAKLIIEKLDASQCGLDMRLETKSVISATITKEQVFHYIQTFDLALDEMGGMMAFMMPDVAGITFLAAEDKPLQLKNSGIGRCDTYGCTLMLTELDKIDQALIFNYQPNKAVPYIAK